MADLSSEHIAVGKKLLMSAGAVALIMEDALQKLYKTLGLGRGLFRRKMPEEVKTQTSMEVWTYLSALLVSMVETWPTRPCGSDLEIIIRVLEGGLLDAQRVNFRPGFESYRLCFRKWRSRASVATLTIFGPMYGLHEEFHIRLSFLWNVPSRARVSPYAPNWMRYRAGMVNEAFTKVMFELSENIEERFRKVLEELWPSS